MDETDQLIESMLPAVEEQLASPETVYVQKAVDRLVASGETPEEARRLVAFCLADEANRMMIESRGFDAARYQRLLKSLPDLPA